MKPLRVDKCKCIQDYKVYNTDVVYLKGKQYICEYHPNGIYGAYYVVYLNDRVSCNVNLVSFNTNFKRLKHESTSTRAGKTSKSTKSRSNKARVFRQ
jgi:hypothetical protein